MLKAAWAKVYGQVIRAHCACCLPALVMRLIPMNDESPMYDA